MSLYKVINYEGKVHWGRGARPQLAAVLPGDLVTADNWWYWNTVCGIADLIGHATEDRDVDCKRCLASMAAGERAAARLRGRFG